MTFKSMDEVRAAVTKAVEFYNKRRPHMSIDMMTPEETRQYSSPIEKTINSIYTFRRDTISISAFADNHF